VTSSEPRDEHGEYLPLHGMQLVLLTIAVSIASFMEILDMTIVNVSIPSIAGSLAVSPSEGTWAISSYMLAAAVVQPLTGWIGRQYGEVRTFVTSALLFVLFSALCGLATSMPMLIGGRLIQGLVSGPMMSVGQALLLRNYPVKLRGLALGLWAMVVIIAPIFGPIMGGWITDNLSWPWLFYINVPVGIIAALIIGVVLRRRESNKMKTPIDALGLALLVIGVGSLQFMLDNGNEKDWFSSAEIIVAAVVAVVAIGFMIPWELTDRHPVVDLHLFRRRNFLVGTTTIAVAYFAFMGVNVVFPLWLQTTLGYTSTWAGLAMAPVGILALVLAPIIGRNLHRINLRAAASVAFLIFGVNIWWVAGLNETASFSQLALPRLFQGIGMPLFFLPLNQIVMSGVGPAELASAAGLSNFIRTISGSISTAVSVYLWNTRTDYHHAVLTEHIRPDSNAWLTFQQQLDSHGMSGTAAAAYTDQLITQQAMTLAVNDVFYLLAVAFLVLIPFVWYARPPFGAPGTGSPH
jgi:DHA2 family multidrug resistance protein